MLVKGMHEERQLFMPGYLCSMTKIDCLPAPQEGLIYGLEYDQIFANTLEGPDCCATEFIMEDQEVSWVKRGESNL